MNESFDMAKFLKDLREGKIITCNDCGEGHFIPIGDPKTTHCFYCDKCGSQVIID